MNWQQFLELLEQQGFYGDGNDFAVVQKWLKDNGHNPDRVKTAAGDKIELKKLFDERPGKELDVTTVVEKADEQKRIEDLAAAKVNEILKAVGVMQPAETKAREHNHDVKVGKDRLEDDPTLGYGAYHEFGGGLFLLDVYKATQASKKGGPIPDRLQKCQQIMTKAASGMNEAVDSDGGWMTPPEHRREILRRAYNVGQVFPRARVLPMAKKQTTVPYIVESSRADGSRHGGVQGYWGAEAGSMTASKPKGGRLTLTAHKLHALGYVTDELEEDGDIGGLQLLNELFSEELAFKLDDSFIRGTGAGQPLGILNADCVVSVTRTTTDRIVGSDILNMWTRLWGRSRMNAVWFINQDTESELIKLNIAGDSTSTDKFLYIPPGGLSGAQYATLFGRPVIPIEQCSTLATVGDIILADMTHYLHGMRRGIKTQESIHVNFLTDEIAFKATIRSDGQPWWQSALTPFQGSNTQSPFITLSTDT